MAKRPFVILRADNVGSIRTRYDIGVWDDADPNFTIPAVVTVIANKALYDSLQEEERDTINGVSLGNDVLSKTDYGEVIDIGPIE